MSDAVVDAYVQAQIAAKERPAVLKIKLLSLRSRFPSGLIVAVEGDDDKVVYSHWIARSMPDLSFEFFVCGGKRGVRSLKNSLAKDLFGAEQDVIYLIDHDFDGLSGFSNSERLFMLERYSVENFLVDEKVVNLSIRDAFPGPSDPVSRRVICKRFEADYTDFIGVSRGINFRIFCARRMGFSIDEYMTDSITPFAMVEIAGVSAREFDVEKMIPFQRALTDNEMFELEGEFSQLDGSLHYRGKFAFKFLRAWISALAAEYRDPKLALFGVEATNGKIKHDELSMGSFAARSSIPNGFSEFVTGAAQIH